LVIYTALRSLIVNGRELWTKYDNGDNLLFREQDFAAPTESKLLLELWQLADADVRQLVGHIVLSTQVAPGQMVMLDHIVGAGGRRFTFSTAKEGQVLDLLPAGARRSNSTPVILPRFSLEELVAQMDQPLDYQADQSLLTSRQGLSLQHFKEQWTSFAGIAAV